jgi:hypothetical protein
VSRASAGRAAPWLAALHAAYATVSALLVDDLRLELVVSRASASVAHVPGSVYVLDRAQQELLGARERFGAGERVRLGGLDVEVCDVTPDGLPRRVRFRFDRPLEDAGLRFIAWEEGTWRPFRLPPIGETHELAPVLH